MDFNIIWVQEKNSLAIASSTSTFISCTPSKYHTLARILRRRVV